jgi:Transposase DDE domain group 1
MARAASPAAKVASVSTSPTRHGPAATTPNATASPTSIRPVDSAIDAAAAGEQRVFGIEALSADPIFSHMAGGIVPSIDTIYRDLRRFDDQAIVDLEALMAKNGLAAVRAKRRPLLHLDVDTTVEPVFGDHDGALPGYNPRYHGRPSYHPILARCAETDTVVGAKLRPGNTLFGDDDAPTVGSFIDRVREAAGKSTLLRVRIDSAGDCTKMMRTIDGKGAHFLIKGKTTPDLCTASCRDVCRKHESSQPIEIDLVFLWTTISSKEFLPLRHLLAQNTPCSPRATLATGFLFKSGSTFWFRRTLLH